MSNRCKRHKGKKHTQDIGLFLFIVCFILGGCSAISEPVGCALEEAGGNVNKALDDAKKEFDDSGVTDILNGEASFYNTLEIENDNGMMKASGKITISDKGEKEMHLSDFEIEDDAVNAIIHLSRWHGNIDLLYIDANGEETLLLNCTEDGKKETDIEISFQPCAGTGELLFRGNGEKAKYSFELELE